VRYENPPPTAYADLPPISDTRQALAENQRLVRSRTMGELIGDAYDRGERGVLPAHLPLPLGDRQRPEVEAVPADVGDELVSLEASIGIIGYQAGTDVRIVDLRGLADPLSARARVFQAWRYEAGHRKFLDIEWYHARYGFAVEDLHTGANVSGVAAARRALSCPPLSDLLDAITEPLTPGRFVSNIWRSVSFAGVQVPVDPMDADGADCSA
jgi:hypothetical protein